MIKIFVNKNDKNITKIKFITIFKFLAFEINNRFVQSMMWSLPILTLNKNLNQKSIVNKLCKRYLSMRESAISK